MNALKNLSRIVPLCIACSLAPSGKAATPPVPDRRDFLVLEALLLHLLTDSNFDLRAVPAEEAVIVLHARTPEKTGFLQPGQIQGDIGSHTLPTDAELDLRQRNSKTDAKPDSYDAVEASFTNFVFSHGIVVADLTKVWKQRRSFDSFEKAYPKARGWLEAYLPGYSKEGTPAVVRAMVGPSAHAASVTALLEKNGDKWVVRWYQIARYF